MVNLEVQNILVEETELRRRAGVANCMFTPHTHTHYYLILSTTTYYYGYDNGYDYDYEYDYECYYYYDYYLLRLLATYGGDH